ncbi:uncharacterized protein [Atheta coriaria]|uniref:uncharacterized protein n=1 Tax=Dalotia coriaria TaxID=877792 RepID=UPI0031F389F5
MSDNIENNISNQALENQMNIGTMGNLQRSINRSLEIAQSSERSYIPGETKSTNHLIFEMNEFYLEMAQKINELKLNRYDSYVNEDEDEDVEDTDSVLYEVVSAIRKKRNNPEMKKQIETVLKLDQMMEDSYKTLQKERMERQLVQKQLCEIIDREDDKYAKTKIFRDLCSYEDNGLNASTSSETITNQKEYESDGNTEHETSLLECDSNKDKFIKRNIQRAKNTPTMSNPAYCLTDEEKVKLDKLLIDLDKTPESDGTDDTKLLGSEKKVDSLLEIDDTTSIYPFSLSEEDQTRMRELESELENLSEVSLLPSKQKPVHDGKPWQNEDRLKQIDAKLEKLQSERESFTFKPTEVVLPQVSQDNSSWEDASDVTSTNNDDTANDVESIPFDSIRERSQEMLARIARIMQTTSAEYSDHEHDEPERD